MNQETDIKALRRRLRLTQKELADAVGVKPNTVARWERGELGISAPMQDRLESVAISRGSETTVAPLSDVTLDRHHEAILKGLGDKLDPNVFEECVAELLRRHWPKLVPVSGGADDGFDGAVAGSTGEPFPLVVTTSKQFVDNLGRNLDRALGKGWQFTSALFATSRRITPAMRRKLVDTARKCGVTLQQIYDRTSIAHLLYREPEWCRRLLGVTGRPAALSPFPASQRPLDGDVVRGREREIRWLLRQEGDCLLVGEPGSGKTFLLWSLAMQGHARFLVDQDRTQIANDLRSLHPQAVIVDDAHVRPAQIAELDQVRRDVGAEFRIIATSWPWAAGAVRVALKIGSTAELRLDPLDADTMVEIIKSIGVHGPDRLLWSIRKQAAGRPGLAATLAHLCLTGNVQDVFSGESLVDELARFHGQEIDTHILLAPFALGGAAGVRQDAVAQRLGRSLFGVSSDLAKLGAAGVIRERTDGVVSVDPDPMRWILVKRVFYEGPGTLEIAPFLEVVEDRQDALHTIIGARSRGAAIPDLQRWLEEMNSPKLWEAYASLGPVEARYALDRHPELLQEIAQAALRNAPETAIPMLLDQMVRGSGAARESSESPLDEVKQWAKAISSGRQPLFERRLALVRGTVAWWTRSRHGEPASRALCVAFMPGFDYSVRDPGVGNTVSFRSQVLGEGDLRALVQQWPFFLKVVRQSERVAWRDLFALVGAWINPQASFFPPVRLGDTTVEILRDFATKMLQDLASVSRQHPGVQHRIGELGDRVGMVTELSLVKEFEVLCPKGSLGTKDWKRQRIEWSDALGRLADNWRNRSLDEVASRLAWCEHEANLAGVDRPRFSAVLCAHLAERVSDPVAAAEAVIGQALPSALVAPFLRKAAADGHADWACLVRRCFEKAEYRWSAVETVLAQRAAPSDLFAAALSHAADMPNLEDFLCSSPFEIPEVAIRAMLESDVPRIASAAAIGYWQARQGEIPESLRPAWRQAVLRSSPGVGGLSNDYCLGEILSRDSQLASDWLVSSLTSADSEVHWISEDLAKTVVQSLRSEQRRKVLAQLAASGMVLAMPDVVKLLVGGDIDLYRHLVESESLKEHHLDPLEGGPNGTWRQIALEALERGYPTQDVLYATNGRFWTWEGAESEMWAGRRVAFEELLSDPDPRIVEIGRAGVEYATGREELAKRRETEEAVEGLP